MGFSQEGISDGGVPAWRTLVRQASPSAKDQIKEKRQNRLLLSCFSLLRLSGIYIFAQRREGARDLNHSLLQICFSLPLCVSAGENFLYGEAGILKCQKN
ncbi:MAG: hypothetical protein A2Y94_10215 [Caldithrix sp. RBG_13_44_9]|nr:MAG: hypothetical protein A2Y94_10215 [Caldithrix sp. RBG_13_44_9]